MNWSQLTDGGRCRMNKSATPSSTHAARSPGPDGNGFSESVLPILRLVVSNLPLDAALEVFRYLDTHEQLALSSLIFGRIVTWRKAAKHGRIPPDEIERIQKLNREHTTAGRQPLHP